MILEPCAWAGLQVLWDDGPTTYSKQNMRDASDLAAKIVAHYGMTDQGLLLFVPPVESRARAEAGVCPSWSCCLCGV